MPIAYVDGNKMALLASIDFRQPSVDDLLDCLVNLDQVLILILTLLILILILTLLILSTTSWTALSTSTRYSFSY